MKVILGIVLLLLVTLAACAPKSVVCPDGTVAKTAEQCPIVQQMEQQAAEAQQAAEQMAAQAAAAQQAATTAGEETNAGPMDADLAALIAKSKKVKSYSFGWAPIEIVNGEPVTTIKHLYAVKGEKVRVETPFPSKYNHATFVPIIYLDLATKSARGWCTNQEIRECPPEGEERPARFSDYIIKLPMEWLDEIPNDAVLKEGPTFFDRKTKTVEYEKDGQYYQLYLDAFYGVPVRVGIYSDPEFRTLTGGVEYQNIAFNKVYVEDVTWPGK